MGELVEDKALTHDTLCRFIRNIKSLIGLVFIKTYKSIKKNNFRIVKNPDGSLAQAAMMQSALSKERRELKMQERQESEVKNPSGTSKNWLDPVGAGGSGFDPSMMAGAGKMGGLPADLPEWKKHIIGGSKGSFGRKTNMTILEQRQSLPIYKLKDELIKAINDNQV